MSLRHPVIMTSHRKNKNVWRKSWSLKNKICRFTFLHAWNSETVPWKSTRIWNLCVEHRLVHTILFAGGFSKRQRKTSKMSHGLEHQKLPWTRMPSSWWGMLSRWPTYLNSGNNWNNYVTFHMVRTIHRIIHVEVGLKKVCAKWVPHFLTGAHTHLRVHEI